MLPVPVNGTCPRCQGRAVRVHEEVEKHNNSWRLGGASCLLLVVGVLTLFFGIGIFLIAASAVVGIIAMFQSNKRVISTYRQCHDCGYQWRL